MFPYPLANVSLPAPHASSWFRKEAKATPKEVKFRLRQEGKVDTFHFWKVKGGENKGCKMEHLCPSFLE